MPMDAVPAGFLRLRARRRYREPAGLQCNLCWVVPRGDFQFKGTDQALINGQLALTSDAWPAGLSW